MIGEFKEKIFFDVPINGTFYHGCLSWEKRKRNMAFNAETGETVEFNVYERVKVAVQPKFAPTA
jgi:hypothetical protein